MTSQQDYNKRRNQRQQKQSAKRVLVFIAALAVIFLVALGITAIVQAKSNDELQQDIASLAAQAPEPASVQPAAAQSEVPQDATPDWNFIGPVEQTINSMEILAPDYRMIALPENGRVDMSYFDSVTFVGDSITQGLALYKTQGIPNAHYCAYKSIGPKQIYDGSIQTRHDGEQEVPMEALVASNPKNVYILLGTNAMVGMDDEHLLAYYREMLVAMREALPDEVNFYIQSITPVLPGIDRLPQDRINGLNNQLAQMAWEEGVYFIDLAEALMGDDGYLRPDFTGNDGYHLTPSGYSAWVEYLVTHTAYHPDNPYLEGSEYYTAIPYPVITEEPPVPEEAAPPPEEQPVG